MEFNRLNKNYLSLLATILLIIILSQTTMLSLLYDTPLGRLILVIFILIISYTNKNLGIIAVLLIVFIFNYNLNNVNYFESFTTDASKNEIPKENIVKTAKLNIDNNTKKQAIVVKKEQSKEGFNLIELEDNIRRKKSSNTMPIINVSHSSENAEPFTGFDGMYTAY